MSNSKIYLALYKGKKRGWKPRDILARVSDWLTRKLTRGSYSHCEIAVQQVDGSFMCYSSSIRDGGVRCKKIDVSDRLRWDLIPLDGVTDEAEILDFFHATQNCKYDLLGALGVVLRWRQRKSRYFCSEWCSELLGICDPWRFSPNDLEVIARRLSEA